MNRERPWWQQPIAAPSATAIEAARLRQSQLTKPPGSLGVLEQLAERMAGFQNSAAPRVDSVAITVFAADHGVVAEGVSAFPQVVTAEMVRNFARGGAAISVLAKELGATFSVVNMGTVEPLEPLGPISRVVDYQLAPGTANFCHSPAMTATQCDQALAAGRDNVVTQSQLFVGGEMGIGNTTAAAALTAKLLDLAPDDTIGRGTGIDDDGLARKRDAIERALALHRDATEPMEILRCLGGLEIAALAGAYIGAAQNGIPSLVDGYICSAAALVACRLNPNLLPWLLFAHRSVEPGHRHILHALSAEPLLNLNMRLGEGSGAAVAVPLLRMACALHNRMATFTEASVSSS